MLSKRKNRKRQDAGPSAEIRKTMGGNLSFAAAEAYKLLRTNLEFSLPDEAGCKVIGITSALRGEGKSTTSVNLAYSIAETGKKVLLMEGDLRLPTLAKRLGINAQPGLSNLLAGQCSGGQILQSSRLQPNMWVCTAGSVPPNPAELLGSEQMAITVKTLSGLFDAIVIDLPPITVVSDAVIVSRLVSGMVVVVRQDFCDRESLDSLVRQLRFAGSKILGFVMAGSDNRKRGRRHYGRDCGDYEKLSAEPEGCVK